MTRDSELYLAGLNRRESSAHAPRMPHDQAADMADATVAAAVSAAGEVRGADPQLDAALTDLHKLHAVAVTELRDVETDARRGNITPEKAREKAATAADEAERRLAVQLATAARALEDARESILGTLLPEPAADTATALKQAELGKLLNAAKLASTPGPAFEAVFRDRARHGDRAGLAVLFSGWGRAAFLEAGGTDERWTELRRVLVVKAAEGPLKDSPVAERLRRLYSPSATKAQLLAAANAADAVKKLKSRGLS